jgi:hypothetical protein
LADGTEHAHIEVIKDPLEFTNMNPKSINILIVQGNADNSTLLQQFAVPGYIFVQDVLQLALQMKMTMIVQVLPATKLLR